MKRWQMASTIASSLPSASGRALHSLLVAAH